MQVQGDLVQLPKSGRLIPLPWHCRAPLGLKSQSAVHVGLVVPASAGPGSWLNAERLPELIATVLAPAHWPTSMTFRLTKSDGVGLLHYAVQTLKDIGTELNAKVNIAIGETATLSQCGSLWESAPSEHHQHDICLLLEIEFQVAGDAAEQAQQFKRVCVSRFPSQEGWRCQPQPYCAPGRLVHSFGRLSVQRGWVELPVTLETGVRNALSGLIEADIPESRAADVEKKRRDALDSCMRPFDLSLGAVTADLHSRAIRFVFPRKGARRLVTRHADRPGVLASITKVVEASRHSILCSHLSQGGNSTGPDSATFVAVCEPQPGASEDDLRSALKHLRGEGQVVHKADLHDALDAEDCLFPQLPPEELCRQVRRLAESPTKRVDELVRQELLRQALHINPLPMLNKSFFEALLRLRREKSGRLYAYVSTSGMGAASDKLDAFIRNALKHFKFHVLDPRAELPGSDGDQPEHKPLASRLPAMFHADIGVFVVRPRGRDATEQSTDWSPLQELAVFQLLSEGKRCLLLYDRALSPGNFLHCQEWRQSVHIAGFSFREQEFDQRDAAHKLRSIERDPLPHTELWQWLKSFELG